MYLGENPHEGQSLGIDPITGGLTLVQSLATIFGGKPSDFRVMLWWDNHAHLAQQKGDKPNQNTVQMANAVVQAMQQVVSQIEAQGGRIDLKGGFATSIGQRDPSYLWYPISPSQHIGDPYHGGPGSIAQLAGPGDPNGVVNGLVNFLQQQVGSAVVQGSASAATAPVPGAPLTSRGAPGTAQTIALPQQISTPNAFLQTPFYPVAQPISNPYGAPASASIIPDLSPYMPYILGGIGLMIFMSIAKEKPAPVTVRTVRSAPRKAKRHASRR
ncbi:MAG: hypothetical protein KGJ13_04995 [Patescibacteria group bacterium]|nr:hypothetical protein [Patescibacteria group bacterium]